MRSGTVRSPSFLLDDGHLSAEYYAFLRRIVDAGFGDRVMFGSDVGLKTFGLGIQAILDAEFLTEGQKRDILYNNAARFLRLNNDARGP